MADLHLSEADLIDRLAHTPTPAATVNAAALADRGAMRQRTQRLRRGGVALATVAALAIAGWGVTQSDYFAESTLPASQQEWVAQESDRVVLLDGVSMSDGQPNSTIDFTITLERERGSTASTVTIQRDADEPVLATPEPGPGGVEVFRSGEEVVLVWAGGPGVRPEFIWSAPDAGPWGYSGLHGLSNPPLSLAGQPMQAYFLRGVPESTRLDDILLWERGQVALASGLPIETADLKLRETEVTALWIEGLQQIGFCDEEGACSVGTRGPGAQGWGVWAMYFLPPGSVDVHMTMNGEPLGEVATAELTGGVAVLAREADPDDDTYHERLRSKYIPVIEWTDSQGDHQQWPSAAELEQWTVMDD